MKISQVGAVQPVASRARRLHDDSSCWKLTVGQFGSQVPSMEGLTLGLFLLGRSRCWGWVAATGFSRGHALLSLRESRARGEKSIIHCREGHLQLESPSTCCGPPICSTCSG